MGYILRLRFSGLCGFVPRKEIDQINNRVRVLLADARTPGEDNHDTHHEPVLVLPDKNVVRGDGLRSGWPTRIDGKDVRIFLLSHQDLFILPETTEADLVIAHEELPEGRCPEASDEDAVARSFRWVAPMEEIDSSQAAAKRSYLSGGGSDDLAGRVLLTRGSLYNAAFARKRDDGRSIQKWEFKSKNQGEGGPRQALSEEVEYEVEVGSPSHDLTTKVMKSSLQGTIRVDLEQNPPCVGYVLNMPWRDFLPTNPSTTIASEERTVDHHFAAFYNFTDHPRLHANRRVPTGKGTCEVQIADPSFVPTHIVTLNNPRCPPTLLAPNEDV